MKDRQLKHTASFRSSRRASSVKKLYVNMGTEHLSKIMRNYYPICKSKALVGAASLSFSLSIAFSVQAIENPDAEADAAHANNHHLAEKNLAEKPQEVSIAWVGLGGAPVSETLAKHLGLEQGVGLTIHHVLEGAPADKVGIRQHDVLVEFDGQKVGDFETLRDAVRAKKPGDEVDLVFVQGGEMLKKKVVLAERKIILGQQGAVRPDQENNPLWRGLGDLPKADHDRMRELMKRRLEELSKQLENDGAIQFDMNKLLGPDQIDQLNQLADKNPAPGKDGRMFNFNAQSSMTVMDEEGSVTIKVTGRHHEVIVKDKQGEILFEGPYETPKDKAAVPDDVRGRIENIDFFKNMKNGFRFEVKPQPGVE